MSIKEQLGKIVSEFKQLPYLFIGTGFSIRYADSVSWRELLFDIWEATNGNNDEHEFKKAFQRIEYELEIEDSDISEEQKKHYVLPQMASELQKTFNKQFYNGKEFESRVFGEEESKAVIDGRHDPFKYYVTKLIGATTLNEDKEECEELQHLKKNQNKIAGIVTTNYDDCLEEVFNDFDVVIGQNNMLLANTNSVFEIYKVHGGISSPNTIVFTKDDYNNFEQKLKYLSAKLLTIFVEHPIIFIGYGMGDPNIQNIFKEIAECLSAEELKRAKDNFIFISPVSNSEDEEIKVREFNYGSKSIPMTEIALRNYSELYLALDGIVSSMPVKMMRKMQNMVTNYIYSTEATNNILFGNINSPDIDDDKVAIYVGRDDTISQMGFDLFSIEDVLEDVLYDNKPFLSNEKLISKTFKHIRSISGVTFLPVYKYIRQLGISLDEIPENYCIIRTFDDIAPNKSERKYIDKESSISSLQDILEKYPTHPPKQHANIKHFAKEINPTELGNYLRARYESREYFGQHFSAYKRLTALYDYIKYK